ncbi:hypothetical protein [Actomonas aquatica]|uniref:Uncharacterized protein n=1 Tax=Actomonas aquatica TaxID=2866162 RepID=A0ABZ1CAR0_9BACT|nr:hypothetical protein [Opitutus sp. WL0086]WRQ88593.1 hypothetical protein K1X11_004200 [Opitutus sp. WL0086]
MMEPNYLIHADVMEGLPERPDGFFQAIIADPPHGNPRGDASGKTLKAKK